MYLIICYMYKYQVTNYSLLFSYVYRKTITSNSIMLLLLPFATILYIYKYLNQSCTYLLDSITRFVNAFKINKYNFNLFFTLIAFNKISHLLVIFSLYIAVLLVFTLQIHNTFLFCSFRYYSYLLKKSLLLFTFTYQQL